MTFSLGLHNTIARIFWFGFVMVLVVLLLGLSLWRFATVTLAEPRYLAPFDLLAQSAAYFPNYAPLQARLAALLIETHWDNSQDFQQSTDEAVRYATRATALSPWNHEFHLLAAHAHVAKGELAEAEAALRNALRLAPSHSLVHWQYANLMLRQNKLETSLNSFRHVLGATPEKQAAIFDLLWQASAGQPDVLKKTVAGLPKAQVNLAQFFCSHRQFQAAADVFAHVERDIMLNLPEGGQILEALLKAGQWELAASLWGKLFPEAQSAASSRLRNGSWEQAVRQGWAQFDWNLNSNKFARIGMVTGQARTGQQSLQVSYLKVDTTQLAGTVQQLVLVQSGGHYLLTGFAKADALLTPDGPQLAVLRADNKQILAVSERVATGTHDWQPLMIDFVAPADVRAIVVTLNQTPQFKYTEPTSGTVWFDDFILREAP